MQKQSGLDTLTIGTTRSLKVHVGVTAGVPLPVRPSKEGPAWDECDHLVSTVAPPPPSAVAGGVAHLSIPLFASANHTKPSYDPRVECPAVKKKVVATELAYNLCHARAAETLDADGTLQPPPNWTGWNQTVALSESGVTDHVDVVGHMPLYNGAAHLHDTQHTVAMRCKDVAAALGVDSTVISSDQDAFNVLHANKRAMPELHGDVVLLMGVLHILIHWWKICGLHMEDSGASDIFAESDSYGNGQAGRRS